VRARGGGASPFAARFTALVGEPPLAYVTRWRMSLAAEYLRSDRFTVSEVADRVGHTSAAALSKAFKRCFGVAPGTYRRRTAPEEGAAGGGVLHCTPRGVPGVMAGTLTPPKMDVPQPPSTPRACAVVLAATPLPLLSPTLACVCRRRGVKAPCRIL
jgi:Helix-turn-helix domain